MNGVPQNRICVKLAVGLFLFFIVTGGMVFGTRYGLRSLCGVSVRNSRFGKAVLCGGYTEIAGARVRPKGNARDELLWEFNDNPPWKIRLLECSAVIDRAVGWNIPSLSRQGPFHFSMGNGYLGNASYVSRADLASRIRSLDAFTGKLAGVGCSNLVFTVCPSRFNDHDRLYENVFDFELAAIRAEAQHLSAKGIPTMDLASQMRHSDLDPHDAFFATDHHFNDLCAVWSAMALADFIGGRFGIAFDRESMAPQNFKAHLYENLFLGSIGKRATLALCRKDDFRFFGTTLPMDFEFEAVRPNGKIIQARGGPKALASDPTFRCLTPYAANPYGSYSYSDNSIVKIHNHSQTNGTRLLFFSDSFDNILLPAIACSVTDVESIDLRHFKGDPIAHVSTNRYDAVILFWSHP